MSIAPDTRPPLLMTRPRAGSERFAAQFRAKMGADWPVVIAPLMEIEPTGASLPEADRLIVTSEQSVAPLLAAGGFAHHPIWCVGVRTAEVLREAGFTVHGVAENAKQLLEHILADQNDGELLHVRGNEVASPLAERLRRAGRRASEAVVYAQRPHPPNDAFKALLATRGPVLVPIFSPNSGRLFADAARTARAELRIAAISPAAEETCAGLPRARITTAEAPVATALLDVLVALAKVHSG